MKKIILILFITGLFAACRQHPVAEQVVFGNTWTGNDAQPRAEGFAIIGDSVVAVGTRREIKKWIGKDTKVIEATPDNLIVPGFIDCHTHFVDGGFALASVHLRDAKSKEEFVQRIADFAKSQPKGTWILNGDWDHENWGGELPSRDWIDAVTPDNPVWINRLDGHMCLANTAALKAAGITDRVKDVPGGTIVRDKNGRLTGIFKDNAMGMIFEKVPPPTIQQEDRALEAAMNYVAERGVTSAHNMSGYLPVFERARIAGTLKTRIYAGMNLANWKTLNEKIKAQGHGDKWLRIGGLKEFVDGSLGSHTAAFFEPFTDSPNDAGFFVISEEELYRRIKSADSAGLQVMTHAIGDKAIHTLLNIYERVTKENGERDRRFRIEHAQHIHPNDIARFASLNVIPSMQPYHAIDDGRWAEKIIGYERCKTTYAFRSLLDANTRLTFGSDWFVAPPTPLEGIYAAVTRRTLDDKNPNGWVPEQKISVEEALKAYTITAAFASFDEDIKGSLEPGKLADYVILEKDITRIDPVEIRNVKVLKTVVGGKPVFEKN
ncbi:MAG: amidohydrolase [Cyclobacteriaceae bacterium]|nr:amidohydrolase [Cyclobacteriaceae bacterium]